jgi:hypothetical protein
MIQLQSVKRLSCRVQILTTPYFFFGCTHREESKNTDKNTGEYPKPQGVPGGRGVLYSFTEVDQEEPCGRCTVSGRYYERNLGQYKNEQLFEPQESWKERRCISASGDEWPTGQEGGRDSLSDP